MTRSHSSSGVSATVPRPATPAQAMQMSSPPKALAASSVARRTSFSEVTSATMKWSASTCASRSSSLSRAATRIPSRRRRATVAAPMPDAPPVTSALLIRNELEQAPVWITEVDALTRSACTLPLDRPFLDGDALLLQVLRRVRDRAGPDEAEVGVAGPHRVGGARMGRRPSAVDVQLL